MLKTLALMLAGVSLAASIAAADGGASSAAPFTPTDQYELRHIHGFSVRISPALIAEKDLCERALDLLEAKLLDVHHALPAAAVKKLAGTVIWMELQGPVIGGCYHPSRPWLEGNGFNPDKAGGIEFGNARNFIGWSRVQPSMLIHELAHAYHHQVLGYEHADIKAAFDKARDAGVYDKVLYHDGQRKKAYAISSAQEYFAEASEAYFGVNDFYPFVRPELREHDPELFTLIGKLWGE